MGTTLNYVLIEFSQLSMDVCKIPHDLGQAEYDEEFSLSISGCNQDDLIYISMPPCYETKDIFEIEITRETAKQIIEALKTVSNFNY